MDTAEESMAILHMCYSVKQTLLIVHYLLFFLKLLSERKKMHAHSMLTALFHTISAIHQICLALKED